MNKKTITIVAIILGIVVLDQVTKWAVREFMNFGQVYPIMGDFLWFQYITNPGMAFGIRWLPPLALKITTGFAIIAIIAIVYYQLRHRFIEVLPFALILGGAFGNFIDRLIFSEVTDFVSFDFPDFIMNRFPSFNVADASVSIGMTLYFIVALFLTETKDKIAHDNIRDDFSLDEREIADENATINTETK